MKKQLTILALITTALYYLTGCEVVRHGDYLRASLGVNSKAKEFVSIQKPDGTHILIVKGVQQNESKAAGSISNGVVSALTKAIIP